MYLSTLTPRQRDISRADFSDAPDLYFNYRAAHEQDDNALILWNRYIDHTPRQIYDTLTGDYGIHNMPIGVTVNDAGKFKFIILKDHDIPFESKAEFDLGTNRDILGNEIKVAPFAQGQGIGRTWLRNIVELSAAFGFKEFHFEAGLGNGGYTWAKAGAHLDRDRSRFPLHHLEERFLSETMMARLDVAKPYLDFADYGWARALCRLTNKDDIVKIAEMGDITVPRGAVKNALPVLQTFFGGLAHRPSEANADVRARDQATRLGIAFCDAAGGLHDHVSLPRFLQTESIWHAVINLADDRQMEKVGEYTGGWRTLKPVKTIRDQRLATLS